MNVLLLLKLLIDLLAKIDAKDILILENERSIRNIIYMPKF